MGASDECYTPAWVFDAMGLHFDIDVAAPSGGPWHVPCDRYYTAEDDGLAQPWDGTVWCNPPYSNFRPWADRFISTPRIALMGLVLNSGWVAPVLASSDAVAFLMLRRFHRPDGEKPTDFRQRIFVAFRGLGVKPAERLAAADKSGAVLYGRASGGLSESAPWPRQECGSAHISGARCRRSNGHLTPHRSAPSDGRLVEWDVVTPPEQDA